jgi:hypothetical protein
VVKLWSSKYIIFVDLMLGRSICAILIGAVYLNVKLGLTPFGPGFEGNRFSILIKAILSCTAFVVFMFKAHVASLALLILLIMVNPVWTSLLAKINENQAI